MKIHRFYIPNLALTNELWLKNPDLVHQWTKVLRFRVGQKVVLFDGIEKERLYTINEMAPKEVLLHVVTDYTRQIPKKDLYLFWSLLKKDKNDWILQKCTELGVSHFIPLIADRSEKTGFNLDRAHRIVIEAAEQCGRSDIPTIRTPIHIKNAIEQYYEIVMLYVSEQNEESAHSLQIDLQNNTASGVFIGPEGGWSDKEKQLFSSLKLKHLNLHNFTLRAETAAIASVLKLLQ